MTLVSRDATSGRWFPRTLAEHTSWLAGRAISFGSPTVILGCQDAAMPIVDALGTQNLTAGGTGLQFQQAVPGWTWDGITLIQNSAGGAASTAGPIGDPWANAHVIFAIVEFQAGATALHDVFGVGGAFAYRGVGINAANQLQLVDLDSGAQPIGTGSYAGATHGLLFQVDPTQSVTRIVTHQETITQTPYNAPPTQTDLFTIGAAASVNAAATLIGLIAYHGVPAEMNATALATILDAHYNGPAVTAITIAPSSATSPQGTTTSLIATATRADGSTFDITATATWTSSVPAIAMVAAGVVTMVATGTVTITASFTSLNAPTASATASITVTGAVPSPVVGTDVPDVVALALSRLLQQDKNKPLLAALVTALISPVQDVVNANWQLATQRTIYTAIGQQLDDLGDLVGLERLGLGDDDYRVRLFVEICVNASRGRTEDLIIIAKLAINDPNAVITVVTTHAIVSGSETIYLAPDAYVDVTIGGIAITDTLGAALYSFLARAVDGGVRLLLRWSDSPPAQTFTLDVGPGLDVGHLASGMGG